MSTDNSPKLKQAFWWPKQSTQSRTLIGTDSGTAWSNTNATGAITFTLPKAAVGLTQVVSGLSYQFILTNLAGNDIVITPKTGDTIRGLATSASLTLTTVGQCVELECVTAGYWEVIAGNTFPDGITGPVTISATAGVSLTVNAASGSIGEIINGSSGQYALQVVAPNITNQSFGLQILAGTSSTDISLEVANAANTKNYAVFWGDGHIELGPNVGSGTAGIVINTAGSITMNAPTASGTTLQINAGAFADSNGLTVQNSAQSQTWTVEILNPSAASGTNYGLVIEAGTTSTDYPLYITNKGDANVLFYVTGIGGVVVPGPTSATTAFTVTGFGANTFAAEVAAGSTTMANAILYLLGGTGSAGVETIRMDHCATTGTFTPTLGTVKPGTANTAASKWIPVNLDGIRYYVPAWL